MLIPAHGGYQVFETWVDDYANELFEIHEWVLSIPKNCNKIKNIKAITPFLER
ncbi:MAG: hypothetical protein AB4063_26160 [Crocosphaera sp.]